MIRILEIPAASLLVAGVVMFIGDLWFLFSLPRESALRSEPR